jgi:hypothetical protein
LYLKVSSRPGKCFKTLFQSSLRNFLTNFNFTHQSAYNVVKKVPMMRVTALMKEMTSMKRIEKLTAARVIWKFLWRYLPQTKNLSPQQSEQFAQKIQWIKRKTLTKVKNGEKQYYRISNANKIYGRQIYLHSNYVPRNLNS